MTSPPRRAAVLLREAEESGLAGEPASPWDRRDGWMLAGERTRRLSFRHGTERINAILRYGRDGLTMDVAGEPRPFHFAARGNDAFDVTLGDAKEAASAMWNGRDLAMTTPRGHFDLHWIDAFAADLGAADVADRIVAPMPGTVTRILIEPGSDVPRGTPLIVMEAMKMEHTLRAPADGHVKALKCAVGDFVQEGAELAEFEAAAAE